MVNIALETPRKTSYPILEENVIVTYFIGFQQYSGRVTNLNRYKEAKGRIGFSGEERFYRGEYVCVQDSLREVRLLPSSKMIPTEVYIH